MNRTPFTVGATTAERTIQTCSASLRRRRRRASTPATTRWASPRRRSSSSPGPGSRDDAADTIDRALPRRHGSAPRPT
jgi:hypothetical protein